MDKATFEAVLIEGHKGVAAVLVPFDPAQVWPDKPLRLAGRRHGWPVKGTVNGKKLLGYIGDRWGRFFVTIDRELQEAAGVVVGDTLRVVVEPARTAAAVAKAIEQSKSTTQPRTARADAVTWPPAARGAGRPRRPAR